MKPIAMKKTTRQQTRYPTNEKVQKLKQPQEDGTKNKISAILEGQIQKSLDANLACQKEIEIRLQKIMLRKKQNRQKVIEIMHQISSIMSKKSISMNYYAKDTKACDYHCFRKLLQEIELQQKQKDPNEKQIVLKRKRKHKPKTTATKEQEDNFPVTQYVRKLWIYNENRRWNLRYFQDPNQSEPCPNEDTKKRRKLEGNNFPHHSRDMKWTEEELNILRESANAVSNGKKTIQSKRTKARSRKKVRFSIDNESKIDFSQVAQILNKEMEKVRWSDKFGRSVHQTRTSTECRLAYMNNASPYINKSKWTKKETLKILELAGVQNGHPAWDQVAMSLNTNRTPWQCFQYYRKSLNLNSKVRLWTIEEDELLLKYITAQGPQFVVHVGNCELLSRNLFPDRSSKQIYLRANNTLLNPKFLPGLWSMDEERKLAFCMKIYNSETNTAAVHFPNRSPRSITDKWLRQLNPIFDFSPFTKEEDKLLLEAIDDVIKKKGNNGKNGYSWGIADICHLFPTRQQVSLFSRWMRLTNEQNLVAKFSCMLKQKHGARKGIVGASVDGAILSPDDFVLRVKLNN